MNGGFDFSSRGRPEAEAFREYAALYAHGSDVARTAGPFRAEVRGWRLQGMLLFDRRLSGVVHSRAARVASDGYDHFVLHAVLAGELLGSAESGFEAARAGDIVLIDTLRPTRTEARSAHLVTISVARHLVAAAIRRPAALHGRVLRPPASLILLDFLRSLARRAPSIAREAQAVLSRVLVELLSAAIDDKRAAVTEASLRRLAQRQIVERAIAARLHDPRLSAAQICADTGISRSALYRLFEEQGGVASLIQARRLSAVRAAIDDGSRATLADLAQTFGFASESHMSRLFAEAFGDPPGAYRRLALDLDASDLRRAQRRWVGWMSEVS